MSEDDWPLAFLGDAPALRNYIVPGLTSYLLATGTDGSKVRVFRATIEQQQAVTPHSHRFDFRCLVLRGRVVNRLWSRARGDEAGDTYLRSRLIYGGAPGAYELVRDAEPLRWTYYDIEYCAGDEYAMHADEIHSIQFSRDAVVLFREGAPVSAESVIIEPWCEGAVVPTFRVEPWMFQPAGAAPIKTGCLRGDVQAEGGP
jgi:hypothetical protein